MIKSTFKIIFLLTVASFAHITQAGPVQTYRLSSYAIDSVRCQKDAESIAKHFETITQLSVLVSGCEPAFNSNLDLVIQYQADEAASLISTYEEFSSQQGIYATRQECEARLPTEKIIFETHTGLQALAAFCFAQGNLTQENPHPFVLRIDGFGPPKMRPFSMTKIIYDKPESPATEIRDAIAKSIASNPYVIDPVMMFDRTEGYSRVVVKYYALRKQPLVIDTFSSFENFKICQNYKQSIDNLLQEFGLTGARSFCAREEFSTVSKLYTTGSVSKAYLLERVPLAFPSRTQCENALSNLATKYAATYGSDFVKGFCSYERKELFSNHSFFAKLLIQQ